MTCYFPVAPGVKFSSGFVFQIKWQQESFCAVSMGKFTEPNGWHLAPVMKSALLYQYFTNTLLILCS